MFAEFSSYFWLLVFLPMLWWLGRNWGKYKQQQHESFFFIQNQNQKFSYKIFLLKYFLVLTGLFLILLALWCPQWGENLEKIEKKGLDIVFVIDVSKSMKALDFSQGRQLISRLDATKYLVENFVKTRKSDRIGLVEFARESFVASPLTLDYTVFLNFLQNISSDDLGRQGTNLAEALNVALGRLEIKSTENRGKTILLFSDGDETISSEAEKMAKLAKEKNIKIFTVGIGSEKGMPIPEEQDAFGRIIYKKWKGETVLSALNPDPLKKIAKITKGQYFHAEDLDDLNILEKSLKLLPKKILTENQITPKTERYFGFAMLGLLLFVVGFLMPVNFLFISQKNFKTI
jgi:Ca-activated chloride channel family protein